MVLAKFQSVAEAVDVFFDNLEELKKVVISKADQGLEEQLLNMTTIITEAEDLWGYEIPDPIESFLKYAQTSYNPADYKEMLVLVRNIRLACYHFLGSSEWLRLR